MIEKETIEKEQTIPLIGKRVYVYFVCLTLLVSGMFVLKARWQKHVVPHQVVVEGINILTKDDVLHLMNVPPNVSTYDMDLTTIQQNILSNSFVKNAVVKRDAPEQLLVEITERVPAAILVSGGMYYIDAEGVVLPFIATTEQYDIPVISGFDSSGGIKSGIRMTDPDIMEALDIINTSKQVSGELYHSISEIRLRKGHDVVLYSSDSGIPIIFGKGDVAKKLVKFDAFREKFLQTSALSDIQYIDIRFADQVVVSRKNS